MIPRWFSRLSLLWKILLSTSVAVTVLLFIAGDIVLNHIKGTMTDNLKAEVQTSFQAYTSLWKSRAELLSTATNLMSQMSDVRAAFGTGDEATIEDTAGEMWRRISKADAIFLVTDPSGKVIARLGGKIPLAMQKSLSVVPMAAEKFPSQVSGYFAQDGELYLLSVTPVYVGTEPDQTLINVLVAGYHIDKAMAQDLKKDTGGSEFLFLTPKRVIASTLDDTQTGLVVNNLDQHLDRVSSEYVSQAAPLTDISGKPVGQLVILRSFEGVRSRIASLYTNIFILWLVTVSAGLMLTYVLARRIVEPMKQLDQAAAEVARENYETEVEVTSEDEIGRLARTFNHMCASIRQAREKLIQQERIFAISKMAASIVHDLRNPLAAIYGGAELLIERELPPTHVKRLATNMLQASRRIQQMLQDLLDVRPQTIKKEVCRLREVAAAACESQAASADAHGIRLIQTIPAEIELPLDRNRIERIFVNLISNALEAMPDGGEVRLAAEVKDNWALVQVSDNGPGISPALKDRLFQPFATEGKKNGLGLGLATSRQAVQDHGGEMWVESEPGHGATFWIRLPGARVAQTQDVSA